MKDNQLSGEHVICSVCRKDEELHWNRETNERLHGFKLCFTCDHWKGHFEKDKSRDNVAIVGGSHYMWAPDDPSDRRWSGHGGAEFIIKFHDGRIVTTHNLWHQGRISEHWIDKFPDNAVFLREKETPTYA